MNIISGYYNKLMNSLVHNHPTGSLEFRSFQVSEDSVECYLQALMCSVSVVTVVFIHTMEDDQRLNTLVHKGDTLHFSISKEI